MARNNNEFRPDKRSLADTLRLHLTKKQQLAALKWLLYGLVLLVLLVVQDVIMSRVRIFGATTDLFCCAVALICILEGPETGGVFSLLASILFLFSGSAPGPYTVALLPSLCMVAAVFRQAYLRKGFLSNVITGAVALMVYEMMIFGICLFNRMTMLSRVGSFFLMGLLSVAVMPLLYPLLVSISKIGGETWKE